MENQETNKEVKRLYFKDMTRDKLYKLFGIKRVSQIEELEDWFKQGKGVELNNEELIVINTFQKILLKNIEDWSENDLSLGFIGPVFNMIDFKVAYKLNLFTQRLLFATIDNYELTGKPDGMVAGGNAEPEAPYFNFHEYKRDVDSDGDPAGQCLAAMLTGQILNKKEDVIYGCYIIGRNWYFTVLRGKEFAISKSYSSDDEEIFEIIKILKALRRILFEKLGIEETKQ